MKSQDLTQYLFWGGNEWIVNSKGRIVAFRYPNERFTDYLSLKGGLKAKYVQGSTPNIYSREFSREPQEGEQLITGNWFFGLFQKISKSRIKQIDKNFHLSEISLF